jgi:hypothetical protein
LKIKIYQQHTIFKKLAKPRILVSVFLLTVLSLLSISYLFSDVNAIGVKADFNGDGKDDLAIGVPGEDVGSTINGGAVQVLYGSSSGLSSTSPIADQFWTQDSANVNYAAEEDDYFGSYLSSGDFNGDGKDDLAIGISGEDLGSIVDAGAVQVLYGSSKGLSATSPIANQFWTQDSTNVNDVAEKSNAFGKSLSSGDLNGDGKDDLAIGVPGEDVGSMVDAGGVEILYGSSSGLSATSPIADQFWTQNSPNIYDVVEAGDYFGFSLSSADLNGDGKDDLVIGVPFEDVISGSTSSAGQTQILYGSSSGLSATSPIADQFWTQNIMDINDVVEADDFFGSALSSGDFNGDGKDDIAIGVDEEDVGSTINGGAVEILYGSSSGLSSTSPIADQFWTQDSSNINDAVEEGDLFGRFLSAIDFNGDGKDDVAIGIPNEDAGAIEDAGAVQIFYGSSKGLSGTSPISNQFWTQDSTNVNDVAEQFDHFGWPLG